MHNFLVGSGGNDNNVFIYDIRKLDKKLDSYSHSAAVKAITWLPNDHTLATGGGTADKKIKFWKEAEGVYKEIDTGSQICSLTTSNNTN
jgi:cell division cycle 20-like protein 1 (cofactor of APC complex)